MTRADFIIIQLDYEFYCWSGYLMIIYRRFDKQIQWLEHLSGVIGKFYVVDMDFAILYTFYDRRVFTNLVASARFV